MIELTVYIGVIGIVGLWAANFMKIPNKIDQFHQQARLERNLNSTLDVIMSDLREANPASIDGVIATLPSPSIAFHTRPPFDINNPSATSSTQIAYGVQGRTLVRTVTTGISADSQVLFKTVDASTLTLTFSAVAGYNNTINVRLDHTAPPTPTAPMPVTTTVTRRAVTRS
jgi:type II secretory pathway pseudopilin PulG